MIMTESEMGEQIELMQEETNYQYTDVSADGIKADTITPNWAWIAEHDAKIRADAINAIKNDLHKRLTEEMNNPYQDQSLCQGLFYGIQRCDWYLDDGKDEVEDEVQ